MDHQVSLGWYTGQETCFKHGIAFELQTASMEVKTRIFKAKQDYKQKMENKVAMNNLGSAQSSMIAIAGLQHYKTSSIISFDGFKSDTDLQMHLTFFFIHL